MRSKRTFRNVIDTTWRPDFAYVIGVIASDGYMAKGSKRIGLQSKDLEMIETFCEILSVKSAIRRKARGGETDKRYYYTEFKSSQFYEFLTDIGITPAKSKTITSVNIPEKYFPDFLRGLFDGDGTFWTYWDTRWPRSFVFHIAFYSASKPFITWLHMKLQKLYGVKGYIKRGAGVYEIRYAKGDSKKIFNIMYYNESIPLLTRKYNKIKDALDFDPELKQNAKHAVVAQW